MVFCAAVTPGGLQACWPTGGPARYGAGTMQRPVHRTWLERTPEGDPQGLAAAVGIPPELAAHLCRRGVTDPQQAHAFLQPRLTDMIAPLRMAGMPQAVERLVRAIKNHERVGLCGDYDVDGVTSTTLVTEVLRAFGLDPVVYIPHRIRDGYGLNHAAVEAMAGQGVGLLLTLDCGVTAIAEVDDAVARGMDVVVIDHHTVPVTLPRAVAVLNPHRPDCGFPDKNLCAVGVAFYLCVALRAALREAGLAGPGGGPDLREYLDLVALGTVADMVPLTGQNRILVAQGLKVLRAARRLGMRMLLEACQTAPAEVDAATLGYQLGPRINAAGRLQDAMLGVMLLLSRDEAEARRLAGVLDSENRARRDVERLTVQQALAMVTPDSPHHGARALVLYDEAWHPGVVGIAAQRMVEHFHRPSILIGAGGKGSGRSIEAFHLLAALNQTRTHLAGFGGHSHAAGLRVEPHNVVAFRQALYAVADAQLTDENMVARSFHDGELTPAQVTPQLMETLGRAAPFGRANTEPSFMVRGVQLAGTRVVGATGEHLQVDFGGSVRGIAFGMAKDQARLQAASADFLFTPRTEHYRGEGRISLHVRAWRPAAQALQA